VRQLTRTQVKPKLASPHVLEASARGWAPPLGSVPRKRCRRGGMIGSVAAPAAAWNITEHLLARTVPLSGLRVARVIAASMTADRLRAAVPGSPHSELAALCPPPVERQSEQGRQATGLGSAARLLGNHLIQADGFRMHCQRASQVPVVCGSLLRERSVQPCFPAKEPHLIRSDPCAV